MNTLLIPESEIAFLEARIASSGRRPTRAFRRYASGRRYAAAVQFSEEMRTEALAKRAASMPSDE